ncbi:MULTISPECIES: stealth family protein [unclassified Streptomyces]|uniref:stealth family protein n=1 Tax=unclassified Streptomyces TaxID=2593676 RepID=UPI000F6CC57C|nr:MULTISPECIES: stealth family protein [unclassified Streptomyces]AZM61371.1 sugar phosphotransferase [Streptomyces sp. WAC 01438]RSM87142.1 sugar phosphotransferase [Streptomyces sp. WAC 01420]
MTMRTFVRRVGRRAERKAAERLWRLRTLRRRRRAAAADPAFRPVTVRGQALHGRVVTRFGAAEAAASHLGLVVAALEREGIPYFLVPASRIRHTVGVNAVDRDRLLAALETLYAGRPVFIGRPLPGGLLKHPALFMDGALPSALRTAPVLRIGEVHLGPAGQPLGGPELACDVEFWEDGAQLLASPDGSRRLARVQPQASEDVFAESLVAPRANGVADVLPASEQQPATVRIGERELPTFAALTLPTLDDVTFPVDVVYTWVDGDDPRMRAARARHQEGGIAEILDKETNASRYTSHDELKYSLRSLAMYADFVRHIYLVTDGQKPHWLDEDAPGITVVDHRDIFPPDVLPVFNSHAIETRLHHIPGLSEHYLYFNDDVFVGRRVTAEHFFHGSGLMKIPVSPLKIGVGKPHAEETATNSANKNVRRLLLDRFGRMTTNNFMHTPLPQQRETLRALEELFREDVARTTASRFRSPQDIAMTAPLLYQYALLTGRGVPGKFAYRYVNISRPDAEERLAGLRRGRRFDFFCLNDVDVPPGERERVAARMNAFLEHYFPFPSPFEKQR